MTLMTLSVWLMFGCEQSGEKDPSDFVRDGVFVERLVILDAQSGVVGASGTQTVIEPNGSWTTTRFWGAKKRQKIANGQFTKEEIDKVGAVLHQQKARELPREFGVTDPTINPNPRKFTVQIGEEHYDLLLPSRARLEEFKKSVTDEKEKATVARFAKIIETVNGFAKDEIH